MFKRSTNHYGKSPVPETPYQRAGQAWDNRLGGARVQARNWRVAAFGAIGLSFLLTAGLIWQGNRSIITPYVVEVSEVGMVRAVGPAMEAYNPTDAQIAWHLAAFIENVRAVLIDPVVIRNNWLAAYDYTTDQGAAILNDYARAHDPFAEMGQRSISIDIISVVRSSPDSFEVRWRESNYRRGQITGTVLFTASLTLVISPPRTAAIMRKNPLGIYVHGINWSQDHVPGGGT